MAGKLRSLRQAKEKVKELLTATPKYRDDDEALLARYWADEFMSISNKPIKESSAWDFLDALRNGKLHPADDVLRARRKVQELFPETRGQKWELRHSEQRKVKRGINSTEFRAKEQVEDSDEPFPKHN